jgi:glycosyltransferase involved in cell wall biosynthesis
MKVLLLANQPENTTRLKMFRDTLQGLGHDVAVPKFGTKNWMKIAGKAKEIVKRERPDAVHVFNVPDIIYHGLPKLKGEFFNHLIYDYRSPWGIEFSMTFGPLARSFGEHFERELAAGADIITTPNQPLGNKALSYPEATGKRMYIIPNYPSRSFWSREPHANAAKASNGEVKANGSALEEGECDIIFVGRISAQEGITNLLALARDIPDRRFWIVGDGPFARWYLRSLPENVKFFGWQPRERVARLVSRAKICLIIPHDTPITPFATEKSIWKLNEYLSMGKIVIATGITVEERRKNLIVVKRSDFKQAVIENLDCMPQRMQEEDYRYWEMNEPVIREAYESLKQ